MLNAKLDVTAHTCNSSSPGQHRKLPFAPTIASLALTLCPASPESSRKARLELSMAAQKKGQSLVRCCSSLGHGPGPLGEAGACVAFVCLLLVFSYDLIHANSVAKEDLELLILLIPPCPAKCWDDSCVPPLRSSAPARAWCGSLTPALPLGV